jgi:2-aminoadipate transaminase
MQALTREKTSTVGYSFAARMSRIATSAVREILKVTEQPNIISFAGGLPAPELFPVKALAEAQARCFDENGPAAMQYSTTEGWMPLRGWIAGHLRTLGIETEPGRVLITSGSQQAIDLVAKIFLDPGDTVLVENPSYLAALQAFGAYEANIIGVECDSGGMRVDLLEKVLAEHKPKLIYTVPEFQNPTGTTLSSDRRDHLIELSCRYQIPILEDDPYGELRYAGERTPPLAARDKQGLVIYVSTFSKTVSPGIRIGWVSASPEVFRELVIAKQASDLHTSSMLQHALAKMLETFDYKGHVNHLCAVYGERRGAMLQALEASFPAGSKWAQSEGGMFVWAELPDGIRAEELLQRALAVDVAFVPGAPFFVDSARHNCLRLNFSNRPPDDIYEGIGRIGRLLK